MEGPRRERSKRVVVGVSGGIAAYKACTVVRQLAEAGHQVRVIPTESALRFVGAATFEALSGEPVHTGVFNDVSAVPHVRLGQQADLVVVAPATADLLARAAAGRHQALASPAAFMASPGEALAASRCRAKPAASTRLVRYTAKGGSTSKPG